MNNVSQIPGFSYKRGELIHYSKPLQWTRSVIEEAAIGGITFRKLPGHVVQSALDERLKYQGKSSNPLWVRIKEFMNKNSIRKFKELLEAP